MLNGTRSEIEASDIIKQLQLKYPKTTFIYKQANLCKPEEAESLVKFTIEKLGGIDILGLIISKLLF